MLPYSNRNRVLFLLLKITVIVVLISFPANFSQQFLTSGNNTNIKF